MPVFLDLGAQIILKGKALEEFGRKESLEERGVTCYVASEVGQHFSIQVGNRSSVLFAAYVHIDGIYASGILINPGEARMHAGVYLTEQTLRPFSFTMLELTDDDSTLAETRKIMDNLGVIEVRFHRALRGDATQARVVNTTLFSGQPVHEKCKKLSSHRVSLGNPIMGVATTRYTAHLIDGVDKPFARFFFRYRPLDLLQAHGIVPLPREPPRERSAIPGPSVDRRDTGKRLSIEGGPSLTAVRKRRGDYSEVPIKLEGGNGVKPARRKQIGELRKQLEELQTKIREVEANPSDYDELSEDDVIKREPTPVRVPCVSKGKRVVIDLTTS